MGSIQKFSPDIDDIRKLCPANLTSDDPDYAAQSNAWSTAFERHPKIAVTPPDISTLSNIVKHLYESDLDFCIRSTGVGGASASDVCVSMQGFKDFHFDPQDETVTCGSGLTAGEIDTLMEKQAPGYVAMTPRCAFVGSSGSALWGGLSWLSSEFGLINDPQNLLDFQIVLGDGRVLWASEEPELLWAMRGGGGNFGAVTAVKTRARPYTDKIFAGVILVPYSSLEACSKEVAKLAANKHGDPKIAFHCFVQGAGFAMPDQGSKPGIAIMPYDAHGEAHGRSEEGFAWAFRLPGAQDLGCKEMTLREINAAASTFASFKGTSQFYLSAFLADGLEDDSLVKVWKWYEDMIDELPSAGKGSTVGLEFLQKGAYGSVESRDSTPFPHGEGRQLIQLLAGCPPGEAPSNFEDIAMKHLEIAAKKVLGDKFNGEYCVGFLQPWNNVPSLYAENFEKLLSVKKKYDSKNRFNKGVDLIKQKVN